MPATAHRPAITWPDLLHAAPYFSSLLADSLPAGQAASVAPLARAIYYFEVFNGEVSNGGVMQYFFNQASTLPEFDRAAEFVAQHPGLADAVPFMRQVHAAWAGVAPAVEAVRDQENCMMDSVSELFKSHADQFEALEREFYAVNHDISTRVNGAILQAPHEHFDIRPVDTLPAQGVAHIVLKNDTQRLRFEDGFPVGPNLFELGDGSCKVVWFSRDRTLLEVDEPGHQRFSIHYPSLFSATMRWAEHGLESHETQRSRWYSHGARQDFRADGSCRGLEFNDRGTLLSLMEYHPDGKLQQRREFRQDGVHIVTYWPNGQVNTRSVQDEQDRERHACCFDAQGVDLAPGGHGVLHQTLGIEDGRHTWREGRLVNGYLDGTVRRYEADLDGSRKKMTDETEFKDGVPDETFDDETFDDEAFDDEGLGDEE